MCHFSQTEQQTSNKQKQGHTIVSQLKIKIPMKLHLEDIQL